MGLAIALQNLHETLTLGKNWEESLPAPLSVQGFPGCGPHLLLVGQGEGY